VNLAMLIVKTWTVALALCLALSFDNVSAQRRPFRRGGSRRGIRGQAPRRGRQDAAAGGYSAPIGGDVPPPVYGASDAVATYGAGDDALAALSGSIPGVPGEDYPIYAEVPETAFSCDGQVDGGYYADPEAECQAFHICTADGAGGLAQYSFLCPNGTLFNQNYFICDWWFNFDCATAEDLYSLNDEIAAERDALAGASDQAQYGAPPEYGAASAPIGDYSAADAGLGGYEEARRAARRLNGNRRGGNRGGRRNGRRFG